MTRQTNWKRLASFAALGLLAATSANAGGRGGGTSNGGGDSWLRGELQNPQFVQPYGYAAPSRAEYRPFYGYVYPYTPYAQRRAVIEVRPYQAYQGGW